MITPTHRCIVKFTLFMFIITSLTNAAWLLGLTETWEALLIVFIGGFASYFCGRYLDRLWNAYNIVALANDVRGILEHSGFTQTGIAVSAPFSPSAQDKDSIN